MKFARYEIQAFTNEGFAFDEDDYKWIPLPELRGEIGEFVRLADMRDKDGRFKRRQDAVEIYDRLRAERPGSTLRIREVTVQEVYKTLVGSDASDPLLDRSKPTGLTAAEARKFLLKEAAVPAVVIDHRLETMSPGDSEIVLGDKIFHTILSCVSEGVFSIDTETQHPAIRDNKAFLAARGIKV